MLNFEIYYLIMDIELTKLILQSGIGGVVGVACFFVFKYFNSRTDTKEDKIINRYEAEKEKIQSRFDEKEKMYLELLTETKNAKNFQIYDLIKTFNKEHHNTTIAQKLDEISKQLKNPTNED